MVTQVHLTPEEERDKVKSLWKSKGPFDLKWYLLSYKWWCSWKLFVGYDGERKEERASASRPCTINNEELLADESPSSSPCSSSSSFSSTLVPLRPQLTEEYDYTLVPENVWKQLLQWYGGGPSLYREAVEPLFRHQKGVLVDLYPLRLSVRKHLEQSPEIDFYISKETSIRGVIWYLSSKFGLPPGRCRLWREVVSSPPPPLSPSSSSSSSSSLKPSLLLQPWSSSSYPPLPEYKHLDDLTFTLTEYGIPSGTKLLLEVQLPNGDWSNDILVSKETTKIHSNSWSNGFSRSFENGTSSSSDSYKPSNEPPIQVGVTGLTNLGNTCFLNSAIQCLSNTVPLAEYFLKGTYKNDVNTSNPLGSQGKLAEQFAELLQSLWKGDVSYTPPINFRTSLCKFAPQFGGFRQHDSQELLAFLLDGLHEDLNLILKKPPTSPPSSLGKTDFKIAEESWTVHLLRNKSIVVDMFQGQLKSTVVCSQCSNISLTFDPFMFLSLPLPTSGTRQLTVLFFPSPTSPKPKIEEGLPLESTTTNGTSKKPSESEFLSSPLVKYKVTAPIAGQVRDLKRDIVARHGGGLSSHSLVLVDIVGNRLYSILQDSSPIFNLRPTDTIIAYDISPFSGLDAEKILTPKPQHSSSYSSLSSSSPSSSFSSSMEQENGSSPSENSKEKKRKEKEKKEKDKKDAKTTKQKKVKEKKKTSKNGMSNGKEKHDQKRKVNERATKEQEDVKTENIDDKYRVVKVVNRRTAQVNNKTMTTAFGAPFVLVLSRTTSLEEVRQSLWTYLKPHLMTTDGSGAEIDRSSFVLRHVNWDGTACAKCKLYCPGCELTKEDLEGHSAGVLSLAVDFATEVRWKEVTLDLSITSENKTEISTLNECLDLFLSKEELSEDDTIYCSNCKEHQRASKKFDIWKLPNVLIIHLKRFQFTKYFREKLENQVDFPIDSLDLTAHELQRRKIHGNDSTSGSSEAIYDLFGIVNHMGILAGGHYTAHCKNKLDSKWYLFNDNQCSEVLDPNSVKTNSAYVLFYQRRGTSCLSIPLTA